MFLRHFLHLLLVNLLLLASLEKRSTCRVLSYFLRVKNVNDLEKEFLVDKTTGNVFVLFWEAMAEPEVEAFLAFRSEIQEPLFLPVLHGGIYSYVSSSSDQ